MQRVVLFLSKTLSIAPDFLLLILARIVGFIFYCSRKKRKTAFKNLKIVFPKKSGRQIKKILTKSFFLFGLSLIESFIVRRLYANVSFRGQDKVKGNDGIFVGIHAGSWELVNAFFAQEYKYAILAQPQKHKALDDFLNEARRNEKINVCFSLKELIRAIKKEHAIGLVVDQGAEDQALLIDFFGQKVPTPKGAVYLARKFAKKIYPCYPYRQKGLKLIIEIGDPIDVTALSDTQTLSMINQVYEKHILTNPFEYVWTYKRFKYKTNRDLVVLSDAKAGHLKQSKALVNLIAKEGVGLHSQVKTIQYRNRICRVLADFVAMLTPKICPFPGFFLWLFLNQESFESLDQIFADIVISTGSLMAPINKMFSSYLDAKSAIILHPNIALSNFDLAIVPEHDRLKCSNAVIIKGALAYPQGLKSKADKCRNEFNLSDSKKIAFFLGGPLSDEPKFILNVKDFIGKLKEFALKENYKLLVSTSRRSPVEVEEYLIDQLKDFSQTEAIVIANRQNFDFVFEGFAKLSDMTFVSSESISMVSEIAAISRVNICVFFEDSDNKRKLFFDSIKDETNFLFWPYDIRASESIETKFSKKNIENIEHKISNLL